MGRDDNQKENTRNKGIEIPKFINQGNTIALEQFSNNLYNEITELGDEDDFLDEVNSSLAEQISNELEGNATYSQENVIKTRKPAKGLKIFAIVISIIMVIGGFLMFTTPGNKIILNIAGKYIYNHLDYKQSNKGTDKTNVNNTIDVKKPIDEVVNILLLGVEEIGGASNTDVMIIATMNTKTKSIKLTSLLRDLYVQIPGYNDNKLNSAYAKEGIELLYDTIENNFGVKMDGYVLVNFSSFEQIVDLLGGVEVTLTSGEASYLKRTNYISNPAYRNVVEGTQLMNGNQALGYCRVRRVSTGTEHDDYGRTQRQRAVLNAMFDNVKSMDLLQLGLKMNKILSTVKITTDITESEFNRYLEEAVSLKVNELENLRIPSDGSFTNVDVQIGKYMQDVLVPKDWDATREEIRSFIYGSITPTPTPSTTIEE